MFIFCLNASFVKLIHFLLNHLWQPLHIWFRIENICNINFINLLLCNGLTIDLYISIIFIWGWTHPNQHLSFGLLQIIKFAISINNFSNDNSIFYRLFLLMVLCYFKCLLLLFGCYTNATAAAFALIWLMNTLTSDDAILPFLVFYTFC